MNQNSYKITLRQQIILLLPLIILNTIILIFSFYKFGWTIATYAVLAFIFITSILPTAIVHIQYLVKNSSLILTLDNDSKVFFVNSKGKVSRHSFSDISKLIKVSSFGQGTGWYTFSEYRFYRIIFKDNTELILTCLLINQIEKNFGAKINCNEEKKSKVLALI